LDEEAVKPCIQDRLMDLSEHFYWVILSSALLIILLLIKFILIPYQIITYDFGINLYTEIIGIVFTIIFITWLYDFREKRRWSVVEAKVTSQFTPSIDNLFMVLLNLCDDSMEIDDNLLTSLNNVPKIELRKDINKYFSKDSLNIDGYIESLEEIAELLSKIQINYAKFWEPELTSILMNLEENSRDIAFGLRTWKRITFFTEQDEIDFFEKHFTDLIHDTIKNIYNINHRGIQIKEYSTIFRFDVHPGS